MPILIILFISLNTWSKTIPPTIDSEIKKIRQLMTEQIEKANLLAKNNRRVLKDAYRDPRMSPTDIKNLKKAEMANLKLLEATDTFLKNQKH